MDNASTRAQLLEHFLSFFMPEGILNFFVLNYFIARSTNASAESLNSKMKAFRAQLRGVSDLPFFMYRLSTIFG